MENPGFVDDYFPEKEPYNGVSKKQTYTFDEAITLSGNGKFHKALLLICGMCLMALMSETLAVSLYVMYAKCDLEISIYEQGILSSTAFFGIVISSHMWGFLSDTWGRLKVIRISIIGSVIFSITSGFSNSVAMLIVLRLLVGIFMSGTQSSVFSYLGEFHGKKTRTQSVAFLSTFLPLGMIFLPALAIGILPLRFDWPIYGKAFSSWRLFAILCTIPSLIASIALPFLPESPKYLFTKSNHDGALKVLRLVYSINSGSTKEDFPVQFFSDQETSGNLRNVSGVKEALLLVWNQTTPMFNRTRVWTSLNLLVHIFMIYLVAHGVYMWFPEMLISMVKHMHSDMTVCEIIRYEKEQTANATITDINEGCKSNVDVLTYEAMIVMGLIYTFFYILIGYLIKIVGKKRLLIIWMVISGICGIAIYWTRGFYLTMVIFIIFLAVGNCGGLISTISVDYYPTSISAMAMCLFMMIGRIGVVVGTNVVGIILTYDCDLVFYGLGSLTCAVAILSTLLPSNLSERKSIDPE